MADTLQFDLVSPERSLASGAASVVVAPGLDGEIGVYPGHAPMVTALRPGVVKAQFGGDTQSFVVLGGVAEVSPEAIVILAEEAMAISDAKAEALEARIAAAEAAAAKGDAASVAQLALDLKALRDVHLA